MIWGKSNKNYQKKKSRYKTGLIRDSFGDTPVVAVWLPHWRVFWGSMWARQESRLSSLTSATGTPSKHKIPASPAAHAVRARPFVRTLVCHGCEITASWRWASSECDVGVNWDFLKNWAHVGFVSIFYIYVFKPFQWFLKLEYYPLPGDGGWGGGGVGNKNKGR